MAAFIQWAMQTAPRPLVDSKTPDPEQLRRINDVIDRLVSQHGYCAVCANSLLQYVGSLLNR